MSKLLEYPELVHLRVARRHRRGAPEEPPLAGAGLLEALWRSLDEIEGLARQILNLQKSRSKSKSREILTPLGRLRELMSLDVRPIVIDPEGAWHHDLSTSIRHDRLLIHRLLHPADSVTWRPAGDMMYVTELKIPLPERYGPSASTWHTAIAVAGGDLWRGHVSSRIDDCARRHRLKMLAYSDVELTAVAPENAPPVPPRATISQSGDGVMARVAPGMGTLVATLWFRTRPEAGARRRAWQELDDTVSGSGLLTEVVELLREAEAQRGRRIRTGDPDSLHDDLSRYKTGDATDLLCRIEADLGLLSPAVRGLAKLKLHTIVQNSNWRLLARCFGTVAAGIADPSEFQTLYAAMWDRSPSNPMTHDLLALVEAREKLNLRLDPDLLTFVRALCESALAGNVVDSTGSELRDMLGPSRPAVLSSNVIEAIASAVRDLGAAGPLRRPLDDLKPIVETIRDQRQVGTLLSSVGGWLAEQLRSMTGKPGMWSPDAEALGCIGGVESFQALTRGVSPWNIDVLAWSRRPLAVVGGMPIGYPGTFWLLMRRWLEGSGLVGVETSNYQADVACWWLRSYCESGASEESLTLCGQWLSSPRAEPPAFRKLTEVWHSALNDYPSTSKTALALELLLTPSALASSVGVFDAIKRSLELEVWKEQCPGWSEAVTVRWQQWVEAVAASGGMRWEPTWAALTLRGVLFDPDQQRRERWMENLGRYRADLRSADFDGCLAEFEWRVLQHQFFVLNDASGLDDASARLMSVWQWKLAELPAPPLHIEWYEWCSRVQQLSPGAMEDEPAFRLKVAALCQLPEPVAREVGRLWPTLPLNLLLRGHVAQFEGFVDLAAKTGIVKKEEFRADFARALFAVATPGQPCVKEISEMVRVLFGRAVGPLPAAEDRALRWQRLDMIDELDPKWKLKLALQLFGHYSAAASFADAVRLCISNLASGAAPKVISSLASLI